MYLYWYTSVTKLLHLSFSLVARAPPFAPTPPLHPLFCKQWMEGGCRRMDDDSCCKVQKNDPSSDNLQHDHHADKHLTFQDKQFPLSLIVIPLCDGVVPSDCLFSPSTSSLPMVDGAPSFCAIPPRLPTPSCFPSCSVAISCQHKSAPG